MASEQAPGAILTSGAPTGEFTAEHRYLGESNVLAARFRSGGGEARLVDLMPVASEEFTTPSALILSWDASATGHGARSAPECEGLRASAIMGFAKRAGHPLMRAGCDSGEVAEWLKAAVC